MQKYGTMTIDNTEEFANAILEVIGTKPYAFVSAYKYRDYKPEVRVNQFLSKNPMKFWIEKDYAGFNFSDTYGVWGASTSRKEKGYDSTFADPYIVIDYNMVEITFQNGYGDVCYWTIKVQE